MSPLGPRSSPSPPVDVWTENFVPTRLQELMYEVKFEWQLDGQVNDSSTSNVDAGGQEGSEEPAELAPGTGLFNDSDKEEADRPRRSRLRRGDETSHWHPPLPVPPVMHLSTQHRNRYIPKPDWDYDVSSERVRLLDVQGEIPHLCYLVHWKGRPLQMSWADDEASDEWKLLVMIFLLTLGLVNVTVRRKLELASWMLLEQRCTILANLVTMAMWDAFEDTRPSAIKYGVSRGDVSEFFKLLQRVFPWITTIFTGISCQLRSLVFPDFTTFVKILPQVLTWLVQTKMGLITSSSWFHVDLTNDFSLWISPPVTVLPLSNQQWIQHVTRVELKHGYKCRHGKRMSMTQRKRKKCLKMQEQQQ
ncbi:LOW QUALITY PROTEIN: hypothetical protein PHPALM_31414 [Phytophthora palmivora]|uniref:Chromo domain-containing protein n=1 Tax=Phytophthora palmivora TaxID=4796 RepID=A0A2P4X2N3_9STRA|nr:LOW QUALITY PROTEIN: hypothetical protein PHPALM_31414 [Phytophthora palmivora]